jgi:hypothetical protein
MREVKESVEPSRAHRRGDRLPFPVEATVIAHLRRKCNAVYTLDLGMLTFGRQSLLADC